MSDYTALHPISVPNGYALAYATGDSLSAQVVADWGLLVGTDVEPADGYEAPRPADDSDDRAAWEAYVVSKGTDLVTASAASLDGLRDMYEAPAPPPPPAHDLPANAPAEGVDGTGVQHPTPVGPDNVPAPAESDGGRPAESARKDEWVTYVADKGADQDWANNPATTKAQLIDWADKA